MIMVRTLPVCLLRVGRRALAYLLACLPACVRRARERACARPVPGHCDIGPFWRARAVAGILGPSERSVAGTWQYLAPWPRWDGR
jgi:hypothetical protein